MIKIPNLEHTVDLGIFFHGGLGLPETHLPPKKRYGWYDDYWSSPLRTSAKFETCNMTTSRAVTVIGRLWKAHKVVWCEWIKPQPQDVVFKGCMGDDERYPLRFLLNQPLYKIHTVCFKVLTSLKKSECNSSPERSMYGVSAYSWVV